LGGKGEKKNIKEIVSRKKKTLRIYGKAREGGPESRVGKQQPKRTKYAPDKKTLKDGGTE